MKSTYQNNNPLTIRMVGSGQYVKDEVATLLEDFNRPKSDYEDLEEHE